LHPLGTPARGVVPDLARLQLAKEQFSWKIFYGYADPMAGELFRIDPLGSPRVGASAVVMRQR
jgi:hypothetical protein